MGDSTHTRDAEVFMTKLTTLPYAAVGAASKAARTIGDRFDEARREFKSVTDEFLAESTEEGKNVVARVPGAARLLGATNTADQPVTDIVGVDARAGSKLRRAGVATVSDMWTHAGDRTGRSELSSATGISTDQLADWAHKADLMRVKSIGPRYAALLEVAGVASLKQLRRRSAESLHEAMIEANRSAKVVEVVPGTPEIADWIDKANLIAS
jgi:predicted flap endonuclease-1-like 5' DNA nuclease